MNWNSSLGFTIFDLLILSLVGAIMVLTYKHRISRMPFRSDKKLTVIYLGLIAIAVYSLGGLVLRYLLPLGTASLEYEQLFADSLSRTRQIVYLFTFGFIGASFFYINRIFKNTASAAVLSDARFRIIVESQSEFIVQWQPGGIRTWVNDAYCKYSGQPREKLLGTSFLPYIDETDRQDLETRHSRMTQESPYTSGILKVVTPDGTQGWQEWSDLALFDTDGSLVEYQSVGRDITGLKLAEIALRESETQYRNLIENTIDWVWEIDLAGKYTYSNRLLEPIFGYKIEALNTLGLEQLIHPGDLQEVKDRLSRLISDKSGWQHWILRMQHKDGSYRYMDSCATPVFDDAGSVIGFRGIDRDVTFQTILSKITSDLIASHLDTAPVDTAMRILARFFRVDVFELWWFDNQRESASRSFGWRKSGVKMGPLSLALSELPWFEGRLLAGDVVRINDVSLLPAEAVAEKVFASAAGASAIVMLPIKLEQHRKQLGIGIVSVHGVAREWNDLEIGQLQLALNLIAAAESRMRTSIETEEREQFQSLIAEISSGLTTLKSNKVESYIVLTMERIGEKFGIDRFGLWWFDDLEIIRQSHEWARPEMNKSEEVQNIAQTLPWWSEILKSGNILKIDALGDMPNEAHIDRNHLELEGVKSKLSIPLWVDGKLVGAADFTTLKNCRSWSDRTIKQLKLLTENIAHTVGRIRDAESVLKGEKSLARAEALANIGSYSFIPVTATKDSPPDGKIICSQEFLKIYDFQPDEVSVETALSRVHPDDRESVGKRMGELFQPTSKPENQNSKDPFEYRILRPDGKILFLEARVEVDRNDDDAVQNVFGTVKNVTERRQREKELRDALAQIEEMKANLEEENLELRDEINSAHGFHKIVGDSQELHRCLILAQKVAPTDATVLILGETGVGKELIAHTIHDLSSRRDKRMISVNCAALPEELIESELFGHEKGAFTGAVSMRKGRFELADGGTFFLDEVGELSMPLQSKLLRAIQEGEFERLGGSTTLKVDARLITATNRSLKNEVDSGNFRADLYYRISNFPINVPSLRERKEDIPLLAEHFVRNFSLELGKNIKAISSGMMRHLTEKPWPGNVRELEGFIQNALITNEGDILRLSETNEDSEETSSDRENLPHRAMETLSNVEREHIIETLHQTAWVIGGDKGAAKILGVPPSTLRSRMIRLGIEHPGRGK